MNKKLLTLIAALLTKSLLPAFATDTPAPTEPAAAPEFAFTPIFNGVDLTGWEGDSAIWSVQEGAVIGHLDRVPPGDRFLVWKGGELADFELRFAYWQPGDLAPANGQAGIRFRARPVDGTKPADYSGYNADILGLARNHSFLIDILGAGKRRDLAFAGQCTVTQERDGTN